MKPTRASVLSLLVALLVWAGCAGTERTTQPEPPESPQDTLAEEPAPPPPSEPGVEPALPPRQAVNLDTVEAGRFDLGKMWTFDNPPLDYFEEAYNFQPDQEWFRHARLGALRFASHCSASFVSPNGLIATNHHCGRESVVDVSQEGEDLLETGFYASSLEEERAVEGLYVEQLIEIEDITQQVYQMIEGAETTAERAQARQEAVQQIEQQMSQEVDQDMRVQVISLYHGAQYSAYTFRRYNNIHLVAAPELALGYYGGDPDNFTYPRYALDFSFFRAYNDEGQPLEVDTYFSWSQEGADQGDAVFVIGNPGSTSRLSTVAQLEYRRDYEEPILLDLLTSRVEALKQFRENHPEVADTIDLRNDIFSLENSMKAYTGRLDGLRDPVLMERRRELEEEFESALEADTALVEEYGNLFEEIARVQAEKSAMVDQFGAFVGMLNPNSSVSSSLLTRAAFTARYLMMKQSGAPAGQLESLRQQTLTGDLKPIGLEERLIAARFQDFKDYLGEDHPLTQQALQGRSPMEAAEALVNNTALTDSSSFAALLEKNPESVDDPAVQLGQQVFQTYAQFARQSSTLSNREQELTAELARARFEVYGTDVPPDATFSLRIADGRVKAYEYNGTVAPPHTTYYGLYDHHYSYPGEDPWDLPEDWLNPPTDFDLKTPLNIVSTNDIIGGNSGSPLLNKDLEVVGLVFDGNIESLSGEFIYTQQRARTVSVDSRGISEALDVIYDADRLVQELETGTLYATEEEADMVGEER